VLELDERLEEEKKENSALEAVGGNGNEGKDNGGTTWLWVVATRVNNGISTNESRACLRLRCSESRKPARFEDNPYLMSVCNGGKCGMGRGAVLAEELAVADKVVSIEEVDDDEAELNKLAAVFTDRLKPIGIGAIGGSEELEDDDKEVMGAIIKEGALDDDEDDTV
jgi:hypothetical protein